jgi:DNA/RNA endonuclease G (NUC1)
MKAPFVRTFAASLCLLAIFFAQTSFAFASPNVGQTTTRRSDDLVPQAGSVSLTSLDAASTQNFDTLSNTAGSTTNDLTITGWYMTESGLGARDNEQYAVDTGGSTTGDTYSYGAAAATDRALGQLRSGTLISLFGASFTNNTGSPITSVDIAYVGEEWRLGFAGRTDQMNFEYSTNATDLVTGTWAGVTALNFVTPDTVTAGAKNGNAAADRTAKAGTITGLSIPNGATFWIRWNDIDATGADDGLAVDDFSITPHSSGPSTNPSVTGSANPSTVQAGNQTLLTATVTPGTIPASTGITATANLSTIGGSATQTLFDDGTNGDAMAGDNIFSYSATVGVATSAGVKSLGVSVTDAQGRGPATANISLTVTAAPPTGQPLPFTQNWSNTGMITTSGDWSSVPGIVGYLGDYTGGTPTGVDPQTLVADFSNTAVNVTANQTAPNTFTSGGIGEFELADPVVAFQGSGSGDAPNIVISLNTSGQTGIVVAYNLRDIDGSTDNSIQPVALQYRVGLTGDYTNIPAAFVADASDGPSDATLVTPVAVALPTAAENQPLVQLRIITTNAVGNDELIGIDDISVTSGASLPLTGAGSASPSNVTSGGAPTLLKVAVGPGTNPPSSGISVVADLSSIGGSATQQFFDDGTNGDVTAGDNTFSYSTSVVAGTADGNYSLLFSVADGQARTANGSINLTVGTAASSAVHLTMGNPSNAVTDVNTPNNYLLAKDQYVMSYNRDQGKPNWVSWHLNTSWFTGAASRQNDFRPDPSLPAGWYQVTEFDYSGSGFDRGHHTPSGDRTSSVADNSATFFMTNMMPQAPDNNQGPWEQFETYCRTVATQGNELYIIAGSIGQGGTGSNGGVTNTVAGGNVTVPSYTWKVAIILTNGNDDVSRVTASTRAIGIIMPNRQGIRTDPWQKYLASVDQVEDLTGYDFFSNVSPSIQSVIESRLDSTSNTAPQSIAAGTYTNLAVDGPNTTLSGNVTVNGVLTLGGSTLTTGVNKIVLGPNATVARLSGMVNGSVEKQFNDLGTPTFVFPVGTGPFEYSPVTANLTAVGAPGSSLTVTPHDIVHPNAPNPVTALKRYWTLTENGDLSAQLTFKYVDADVPASVNESAYRLNKYETAFSFVPSSVDPVANTASTTSSISEFSDWTLLVLAPTAAGVTISGRVSDSYGRSVSGATVWYSDGAGNSYSARTNPFGYYSIANVPAGVSYIGNVKAKRYSFEPRVLNLSDSIADADFVANP